MQGIVQEELADCDALRLLYYGGQELVTLRCFRNDEPAIHEVNVVEFQRTASVDDR